MKTLILRDGEDAITFVPATEARAQLKELLDLALQGKTVIITRQGVPCAQITPIKQLNDYNQMN